MRPGWVGFRALPEFHPLPPGAKPGETQWGWVMGGELMGPNVTISQERNRIKNEAVRARILSWYFGVHGGPPRCVIAVKCKGEPCDPSYLTLDHKNGRRWQHVLGNLQPACVPCNAWAQRHLRLVLENFTGAVSTHRGTVGGGGVPREPRGALAPTMHRGEGVRPASFDGAGGEPSGSVNDKHEQYLARFLKAAPEYFRIREYGGVDPQAFIRAMVGACTYTDGIGQRHEPSGRATIKGFVDERLYPDNESGLFHFERGLLFWAGPRLEPEGVGSIEPTAGLPTPASPRATQAEAEG